MEHGKWVNVCESDEFVIILTAAAEVNSIDDAMTEIEIYTKVGCQTYPPPIFCGLPMTQKRGLHQQNPQ